MTEENWERKYEERCNICGESIDYIIKQKVREAQKELIPILEQIINTNGLSLNSVNDGMAKDFELRKLIEQLNNK